MTALQYWACVALPVISIGVALMAIGFAIERQRDTRR